MQNEVFTITLQNKLAPDQMLILRVHEYRIKKQGFVDYITCLDVVATMEFLPIRD
jgi:hypothetical protein